MFLHCGNGDDIELFAVDTVLAAWRRLKHPRVAVGALASSAPILQFEDIVPPETFYNNLYILTLPHFLKLSACVGAHHIDLRASTMEDPDWLVEHRATEVELIHGWLDNYRKNMKAAFKILIKWCEDDKDYVGGDDRGRKGLQQRVKDRIWGF
ncbi:hypothetical protein F3Y22_tig00110330pilonHSYRG00212 [Hibiscus syriacus]|uniref:Uncharacterized protein n=1 Tax=Hibiscus syriacus TaxID=106335 RepID=A0A6A3B2J5_HIBSY|nr:hypothetical protein F3Y22_tig00110330pilonHSYRG00212 [Hibiscus syriacus]